MFDTYYADPLSQNVMTAIAENWKTTSGSLSSRHRSRTWPGRSCSTPDGKSAISFWGAANGPTGDRGYNYFYSKNAYPTGSNGVKGYHYENADVDAALDAARKEFDQAKQDALYQQVCQVTHDDLPNLYLWQSVRFHVVSKKRQELHRDPRRRRWLVLRRG